MTHAPGFRSRKHGTSAPAPAQTQIEAVRKELLDLVRVPADASWNMDYVARRVLAAAEQPTLTQLIAACKAYQESECQSHVGCMIAALTAAAEVGGIDALVLAKIAAKEKEKRDLAVAEMKERCAQAAEEQYGEWDIQEPLQRKIAAAIRALPENPHD